MGMVQHWQLMAGRVLIGLTALDLVVTGCTPGTGEMSTLTNALPAPEDMYNIINERYERGSILLTSNRAPMEWPDLFGDPLLASAGLDCLTHHAEALISIGSSFPAQGRHRLLQEVPIGQPG